ncbi:MAG TPA: hypothetical protein VFQ91_17335 [Bryobacteraceae bacterium]|nr:hypothetical protein [Bryobacteraceae bacterium]
MKTTQMTCPLQTGNEDVLFDYCAHSLDAQRRAMLEQHMSRCTECADMVRQQSAVWDALDAYDADPISPGFNRTLFARIEAAERVPFWQRIWAPVNDYLQGQPVWKPVLSLVAASAVVAVVFLAQDDHRRAAAHRSPASVDVRDIEQAERALEDMEMLRQLEATSVDGFGAKAQKEVL